MNVKFLVLTALLCLLSNAHGQIGIRASYGSSQFSEFKETVYKGSSNKSGSFLSPAIGVGINYWFRLKKRRIEFLPEIGYSTYGNTTINSNIYKGHSFDLIFNTQVYVLDLAEDCDCPTFSKQGNTIKKGFFLHFAPMAKMFSLTGSNEIVEIKSNNTGIGVKFGLGLDLGLSDLITLTPILSYERTAMISWRELDTFANPIEEPSTVSSNYGQMSAAIRLGLRLNSPNKRFRR